MRCIQGGKPLRLFVITQIACEVGSKGRIFESGSQILILPAAVLGLSSGGVSEELLHLGHNFKVNVIAAQASADVDARLPRGWK